MSPTVESARPAIERLIDRTQLAELCTDLVEALEQFAIWPYPDQIQQQAQLVRGRMRARLAAYDEPPMLAALSEEPQAAHQGEDAQAREGSVS